MALTAEEKKERQRESDRKYRLKKGCVPRVKLTEEEKKERKKEYQRKYKAENKEMVYAKRKKYEEDTKEERKSYSKKYRAENIDKLKEKEKNYRENNKELIAEKRNNRKDKKAEEDRKYRENNKEKVNLNKKIYYENNKEEISLKSKVYRQNNKEKKAKADKNYVKNNKEKVTLNKKIYYENNKKEILVKNRIYVKYRRKTDVVFNLQHSIRALIGLSITKKGYTKKSRTFEILGCSYEDFKIHLEKQFESWMNWENKGNPKDGKIEPNKTWDIDHIIPLATATSEEDIIKLNHYTNLRPLCSYYNRVIKRHNLEEDLKKDLVDNL